MNTISYQPELRPELPLVNGPQEYNQQRDLFIHLDQLLSTSELEAEFFNLSLDHQKIDISSLSQAQVQNLRKRCTLALRSNLARMMTGLNHRDFCIRLADSSLLQWFLQVGRVDGVKTFAKSTSDRFAHFVDASSLQDLNAKLIALLKEQPESALALQTPLSFDAAFFDSTCLKAPIHHPVDWLLLRDATRTLMKAVERIRKEELLQRMPKAPLLFLSEMNTLCMAMTAKQRTSEGKKHRKKIFRHMKALLKRIQKHAQRHLDLLKDLGETTGLHSGQIQQIITGMDNVIAQVPTIIKQAHERIIGGRKLCNKQKVLSLYDPDVEVIKRGKSSGEIEFGNNLWLGENRDGLIIDYLLEKEKTSDSKQIEPAIERLCLEQSLPLSSVWGDRGLHSAKNEELLKSKGIYNGLCPRDIHELSERLANEPELREGLKRRASTEGRISIILRKFMGTPSRAKGFAHRAMMVGWAVFAHNLWKLARLKQGEASSPSQARLQAAA